MWKGKRIYVSKINHIRIRGVYAVLPTANNINEFIFFSYHQKVPYDAPDLEIKDKTFGLVAPEEYSLPSTAPLWTPVAYAAFDVALNKDDEKNKKDKKVCIRCVFIIL